MTQPEFRGPRGPCAHGGLGHHPHSAEPLFQVLSQSLQSHLPSGPVPSCPAGSRCPLPPSPPTSEAHSPVLQTDFGCPCRSRRKQKPRVRPGWSTFPYHHPCNSLCIGQPSPLPNPWLWSPRETMKVWELGPGLSWTWKKGTAMGSTVCIGCGL